MTAENDHTAQIWDAAAGGRIGPPLRHASTVVQAGFSPDGRALLTLGGGGSARIWELPSENRPAGRLVDLAERLSRRRIHAGIGVRDAADLKALWNRGSGPAPQPAPGQLISWHERLTAECFDAGDEPAATPHLDALLAGDPGNQQFRVIRALTGTAHPNRPGASADPTLLGGLRLVLLTPRAMVAQVTQNDAAEPLTVGRETWRRGLSFDSPARLVLFLPAGARVFRASIGVDDRSRSRPPNGALTFSLAAGAHELYRSPALASGDAALPISVLLHGASSITLETESTGQLWSDYAGDWAEASVLLEDGRTLYLSDLPLYRFDEL